MRFMHFADGIPKSRQAHKPCCAGAAMPADRRFQASVGEHFGKEESGGPLPKGRSGFSAVPAHELWLNRRVRVHGFGLRGLGGLRF
jgi:hypothetical protein